MAFQQRAGLREDFKDLVLIQVVFTSKNHSQLR
jgi:hypothetical protein